MTQIYQKNVKYRKNKFSFLDKLLIILASKMQVWIMVCISRGLKNTSLTRQVWILLTYVM